MRLIILGAGGFGRTIADIADQLHAYDEIKYLDDMSNYEAVIGKISDIEKFINDDTAFFSAIGDNTFRCELIERVQTLGGKIVSVIHPSAYISPTVKVESGVAILPHASIGTNVVIGAGCIINMNSIIDHDCILDDGVHVAPGAIVKGENHLLAYTKIESGIVVERGQYKE